MTATVDSAARPGSPDRAAKRRRAHRRSAVLGIALPAGPPAGHFTDDGNRVLLASLLGGLANARGPLGHAPANRSRGFR
jgi:hypothetical protein